MWRLLWRPRQVIIWKASATSEKHARPCPMPSGTSIWTSTTRLDPPIYQNLSNPLASWQCTWRGDTWAGGLAWGCLPTLLSILQTNKLWKITENSFLVGMSWFNLWMSPLEPSQSLKNTWVGKYLLKGNQIENLLGNKLGMFTLYAPAAQAKNHSSDLTCF